MLPRREPFGRRSSKFAKDAQAKSTDIAKNLPRSV
jgi:hypothetical protein